jgi:hypothetical protein
MGTGSPLESVLKRDRLVVMIGLALVVAVAAAYTLAGVGMNMSPLTMTRMAIEMPGMAMPPVGWSAGYAFVIFPDVVRDDGRHDGAERRTHGTHPRRYRPQTGECRPHTGGHCDLCCGLPYCLDGLQPCCHRLPMGTRVSVFEYLPKMCSPLI